VKLLASTAKEPAIASNEAEGKANSTSTPLRHIWLKYVHGFLMFYSYVMILGAAGAFGSNARSHNFPYGHHTTDQLYGRCFGRNLNDSAAGYSVPGWVAGLQCGTGVWCEESALGGQNPFVSGKGSSASDDENGR